MAEPAPGHSTLGFPPVAPQEERRALRLSMSELLAVIGLAAGFLGWLTHVSLTAGATSTKVDTLERGASELKATLENVKAGVTDLRVEQEKRTADLRERLARIEALLTAGDRDRK